MKIGRVFVDLLSPLDADISIEEGLARTLRRLIRLTSAQGGAPRVRPAARALVTVSARAREASPAVETALRERVSAEPARAALAGESRRAGASLALLRAPLGGRRAGRRDRAGRARGR